MTSPASADDAGGALRRVRIDPLLTAIIVGGACLRFVGIGSQSLWYDEFVTMDVINRPLTQLPRAVAQREGTPPLYYVLVWGWNKIFGSTDTAVRSFSALAGVALILVVYALAVELGLTRRIARIAALIVAVNPMLVWYSQEARAYALFTLLGAISLLLLARCVHRGAAGDYVLWSLSAAAAISTHYFAFLLVAGEAVWLLCRGRGSWRSRLLAVLGIAIAAAPLVLLALRQRSTNQQDWIVDWPLGFRVTEAGRHLLVGPAAADDRLWVVVACLTVVAIALLILRGEPGERRASALLATLTVAVIGLPLAAAAVGVDYFLDRNILVALIPFVVILGAGLGTKRAGTLGTVMTVALCVTLFGIVVEVTFQPTLQRADWRAVADVANTEPEGVVVLNINRILGRPLLRYLDDVHEVVPGETVETTEIDVLSLRPDATLPRAPCSWWFGRSCVFIFLGGPLPHPLADQFRLIEVRPAGQFLVSRYKSSLPVEVRPADLVPSTGVADALVVWHAGHGSGD